MTTPAQQQRIAPDPEQLAHAAALLVEVPAASFDWASDQGRRFLAYVDELAQRGVPTAWLAEHLGLDPNRLYATMARYRTRRDLSGTTTRRGTHK